MDIGFTEYEAKAYYTLLKMPSFTATELSKIAGIPRTKVYSVLGNLVQKGACTELPGKVVRFKAVEPTIAFQRILQSLDEKKDEVVNLADILLPIFEAKRKNEDPLEYIEVIRDRQSIVQRLDQLELATEYEIVTMNKPPYAVNISQMLEENAPFENKNISYKYIYEISDLSDPDLLELLKIFVKNGVDVRICKELPVKLAIFDSKVVLMSLDDNIPHTVSLTGLVITHSDFSNLLRKTFEMFFNMAIPLDEFLKQNK
jgi:sugar-specific transcriptional regulator TrmB